MKNSFKIYISSDHGGFNLKETIVKNLLEKNIEVINLGPFSLDLDDDYPDFAEKLAIVVAIDRDSKGILICKSGNGMCIASNKIKGAYACTAFTPLQAQMAVTDDNANILCLDSEYTDNQLEKVIAFVDAKFAGLQTRHGRRFKKIQFIENNLN